MPMLHDRAIVPTLGACRYPAPLQATVPEAARVPLVGSSVDWHFVARRWVKTKKLRPGLAIVIQGNNRLEVIDLESQP